MRKNPRKDKQYCDDCGEVLRGKKFVPFGRLPFSVASANKGESAVVCLECMKKPGRDLRCWDCKKPVKGKFAYIDELSENGCDGYAQDLLPVKEDDTAVVCLKCLKKNNLSLCYRCGKPVNCGLGEEVGSCDRCGNVFHTACDEGWHREGHSHYCSACLPE